jgi:hypothetical protein
MRKIFLVLVMAAASIGIQAQNDYSNFSLSISNYNRNYSNSQVSSLYYNHYGIPQQKLNELYMGFNMNWGDVVLAIELSRFLNVPINTIYENYHMYGGRKGWGNLAKRHGIKPGSAKFRNFKQRMNNENVYWRDTYNDYKVHKNPKIGGKKRYVYPDNLMRDPLPVYKNRGRDYNDRNNKNKNYNEQRKDQKRDNQRRDNNSRNQGRDDRR